ncbi:MAG: DNA-binding response regulator [Gammaproteobacteria bacterium]|nr:MAG: DNA-binding response regulator [Gammaproteobacteria bacterium]RLA24086.1 MAG: DNA-binding response regulator [Gammaproteobacteria bacterium]
MNSSIVIADDHPLFREAVTIVLQRLFPQYQLLSAESLNEVLTILRKEPEIKLVLLDLNLPDSKGMAGITQLKSRFPEVPVVIVSASHELTTIHQALYCGAMGFIPKTEGMSTISEALKVVCSGGRWVPQDYEKSNQKNAEDELSIFTDLTPMQLKVLFHLRAGESNKEIAGLLFVTEATVKAHITAIFRKLGVSNRTQAVLASQALEAEE